MTTFKNEKQRLRKEVLVRRNAVSTVLRVIRSADILQRFFELEVMRSASWVHFYVSCGSEVETTGMIAHALARGKRVSVPKMESTSRRLILSELKDPARELSPGPIGIPEPKSEAFRPVELDRMDLFVVPGVAFDQHGNRLGQGAGYYDRLLSSIAGKIPIIGLAFELQLVDRIPTGDHDIKVNGIVTEKRVIECGGLSGRGA
ncbi:MAG: 5-formyltetrahydrofolate cyclo-ligase [Nitrospirae bacterium]|nr:5-formyltetrahydrofolate cyclo-ligase [Nitrospirota bacterium]